MFVSAEVLAIVISAAGVVLTLGASLFAGFAWIVRRMDAMETRLCERMDVGDRRLSERIDALDVRLSERIEALDTRLSERIEALDMRLSERIEALDMRLSARIDALAGEVTEVKIGIARLEGPPRHLVIASR
jgi:hypothetical protein